MPQMAGTMTGGKVFANLVVKGKQADGIALEVKKIGESSGQSAGVFRLRKAGRTVGHRAAHVGNQKAAEVRFVLELLDKITVAARVNTPIQKTRIVVRC